MKKRDKDDPIYKMMRKKEKEKKGKYERGHAPKLSKSKKGKWVTEELLDKLELFSETRVGPKGIKVNGVRPIQFMKWWGEFRPGDRVDVDFGDDYIALAGTNAEGNFAGIKKELDIDDEAEMMEFISSEGNVWNFV